MTLSDLHQSNEAWTICIHTTSSGDYERAEKIAAAMEKAANRNGAEDTMVEILQQGPAHL